MNEIFQKVSAAETEDLLAGHQSICGGKLQNISNLLSGADKNLVKLNNVQLCETQIKTYKV